MAARIALFYLLGILLVSCATDQKTVSSKEKEEEVLYILPDGRMEFKGRLIDEKDVVVYKDGRGGERAAIKIMMPLHSDAYRDTIEVERVEVDVPVARKD